LGPQCLQRQVLSVRTACETYTDFVHPPLQNVTKAHRVARHIEAGMVWINSSNDSDVRIPFGGVKQSGIGRELGEAGLEAYTNKKVRSSSHFQGRYQLMTSRLSTSTSGTGFRELCFRGAEEARNSSLDTFARKSSDSLVQIGRMAIASLTSQVSCFRLPLHHKRLW
jgi:hypothetical protein